METQDVCIQGKLSKATLKEKDPTFFEAVENGVTWEVVPSFIAKEFPQLADIIQQSGNASLNRGENELQMLRRLHNLFMQKHSNGEPVDFQAIKQRALAAKPPFAASLAHMWAFALKFSGGSKAPLLLETELFCPKQCEWQISFSRDLVKLVRGCEWQDFPAGPVEACSTQMCLC